MHQRHKLHGFGPRPVLKCYNNLLSIRPRSSQLTASWLPNWGPLYEKTPRTPQQIYTTGLKVPHDAESNEGLPTNASQSALSLGWLTCPWSPRHHNSTAKHPHVSVTKATSVTKPTFPMDSTSSEISFDANSFGKVLLQSKFSLILQKSERITHSHVTLEKAAPCFSD